jgi:hypothetical protein
MNNAGKFAHTVIDGDLLEKITGNRYLVLSINPYKGKDDVPEGVNITALIQEDHAPEGFYGFKADGFTPREGVKYQNINITILSGNTIKTMQDLHVGDEIAVFELDQQHSYFIDFNLILRFKRYKKLNKKGDRNENSQSTH